MPKSRPKIEPVDTDQCQAEKNKHTIMSLGGSPKRVRCTNKPKVIATEKKKGADGQRGAMSLCADCLPHFKKQMPKGYADFVEIGRN